MPTPPTPPFWFRQRQGKAEPVEPTAEKVTVPHSSKGQLPFLYRLTAPNLGEAFIGIRQAENGRWLPVLQRTAAGPDLAETAGEFATAQEAWDAAFELYRVQVVV